MKQWFSHAQSARLGLRTEAGVIGYSKGDDVLDSNVATNMFKESISNMASVVGQNKAAYAATQQQAAAQAQMTTTIQAGQQQIPQHTQLM